MFWSLDPQDSPNLTSRGRQVSRLGLVVNNIFLGTAPASIGGLKGLLAEMGADTDVTEV